MINLLKNKKPVHAKSPDISRQIVMFLCVERGRKGEAKRNFARYLFIIFLTYTDKARQIFILKKKIGKKSFREREKLSKENS